MKPIGPHPFELPEDQVADLVGIPRAQVAAARGSAGSRWDYGPNRRILWSFTGLEALKAEIGEKNGKTAGPPAEKPAEAPRTLVFIVKRSRLPNPRVLLAVPETPAAGDGCAVPVYLGSNGDNRRFPPGLRILARPYRGQLHVFEGNPDTPELGRRQPRRNGRW